MASDGVSDYTAYREEREGRAEARLETLGSRNSSRASEARRRRRTKHEEGGKEEEYFMPQLRLKSSRKHET